MATYTVHTYFNQEQMVATLNAVVMIVGSSATDGNYVLLVKMLGIVALMGAILYGIWRARGEDAVTYLIAFAIIYSCLLVPRVTVHVEDNSFTYGTNRATETVDNVPVGLAFFLSATSQIGYYLTNKFESVYSLPNGLHFSQNGLMAGNRVMRESMNAHIGNPVLDTDLTYFMLKCINPEILRDPESIDRLLKAQDIWAAFNASPSLINPGRMVSLPSELRYISCEGAYARLSMEIDREVPNQIRQISRLVFPGAADPNDAEQMLRSLLPVAAGMIQTSAPSIEQAIKQRMMLNMMDGVGAKIGVVLQDPASVMLALGTAQAASTANSSFRVSAELARQTLPFVHNIVELIIVGIFPIVFLLMVLAGQKVGFVIRNYVTALMWVQLWAPIYAIVNAIGTTYSMKNANLLMNQEGPTLLNSTALANTMITGEGVAGMMTGVVVLIAFALLKGGEVAMSGLVQSVTRPAESAAQKAGSEVGSGNVSMGNLSWGNVSTNNTSANQYKTSGTFDTGTLTTTDASGTIIRGTATGGVIGGKVAGDYSGPIQVTGANSAQISSSLSNLASGATNYQEAARVVSAINATLGDRQSGTINRTVGETISESTGIDYIRAMREGMTAEQALRHAQDFANVINSSVKGGAGLSVNAKGDVVSANGNLVFSREQLQQMSASHSATSSESTSKSNELMGRLLYNLAKGDTDTITKSALIETAKTFTRSILSDKSQGHSAEFSRIAQETEQYSKSTGVTLSENLTLPVFQRVADKRYNGQISDLNAAITNENTRAGAVGLIANEVALLTSIGGINADRLVRPGEQFEAGRGKVDTASPGYDQQVVEQNKDWGNVAGIYVSLRRDPNDPRLQQLGEAEGIVKPAEDKVDADFKRYRDLPKENEEANRRILQNSRAQALANEMHSGVLNRYPPSIGENPEDTVRHLTNAMEGRPWMQNIADRALRNEPVSQDEWNKVSEELLAQNQNPTAYAIGFARTVLEPFDKAVGAFVVEPVKQIAGGALYVGGKVGDASDAAFEAVGNVISGADEKAKTAASNVTGVQTNSPVRPDYNWLNLQESPAEENQPTSKVDLIPK